MMKAQPKHTGGDAMSVKARVMEKPEIPISYAAGSGKLQGKQAPPGKAAQRQSFNSSGGDWLLGWRAEWRAQETFEVRITDDIVQWQWLMPSGGNSRGRNFSIPLSNFSDNLTRFNAAEAAKETLRLEYPERNDVQVRQLFSQYGPMTQYLETLGQGLIAADFAWPRLHDFIWWVCQGWGGAAPGKRGNLGRGRRAEALKTSRSILAEQFKEAHAMLCQRMAVEALAHLHAIDGLGISYSSKLLKFLDPNQAVVLDSRIRALGYSNDLSGYGNFLDDCHRIMSKLQSQTIRYTGWSPTGWRVSDVEMAIFAALP